MRMLGVQGVVNIGAFSPTPETGCTHSQGYWKNHPEAWPVERITIGEVTYPKTEAIAILVVSAGGDATYILAHQLIAAKLNVASGADPSPVADTIEAADRWLIAHPLGSNPDPEDPARAEGIAMAGILTEYNEGAMGPRRCEDSDGMLHVLVIASPTDTVTETATSTPTATATPTPTDTPLSIEAATPTETPTPTDTPLPDPSAEDSPTPTETEFPTPTESPTPAESEAPSG
jgi:hypothetical protein